MTRASRVARAARVKRDVVRCPRAGLPVWRGHGGLGAGVHCQARAIRFRLATAGRSFAQLDLTRCTGCGACVAVCPAGAVSMQVLASAEAVA